MVGGNYLVGGVVVGALLAVLMSMSPLMVGLVFAAVATIWLGRLLFSRLRA